MSLFERFKEGLITNTSDSKSNVTSIGSLDKDVLEVTSQTRSQDFWKLEAELHDYLLEELKRHPGQNKEEEKQKIEEWGQVFFDQSGGRLTFEEKQEILNYVENELLAYGPITPLLENPMISEVMVNSYDEIYYEKNGKILRSTINFVDNQHVMRVIERIVSPIGRRVDESSPMVDARLPDGSRVNAIIPPLALKGPSLTIRKFSDTPFTINDLIRFGTLSVDMAEFLDICVKSKLNIFISGGTGSGKTSTLNVLSSFIPNNERIVTIEDAAELKLNQEHVVSLESRPPNIEGKGQISIRDLVRNSLRMRPDRIVVGEVRGAEALDMLQAMNTGHDGSLSTGHANSPRDILSRLETMVLMAGFELPVKAIREQIANAIDVIVQQTRLKDGTRKITYITEVLGMEGDTIVLQDIYLFNETGRTNDGRIEGKFTSTGIRPKFTEKLEMNGHALPASWFVGEW
ncbi:CpaF family protein [Neobacillus sp. OS1-33]|jgi:pilus assembly protein CpaF|uniref:CpaF family protein n=1 Tax=Neobacillus sp. OS1-33 TaxID=3070683 RepID=UPI0027E0A0CA|nr:CpaF family protein [Neobacillus sp. OS1-33]WML24997.1 CpaF family protein [Neobacillus sp. OS1-33]